MAGLEYTLHLWKKKPENLSYPNEKYWTVHVKDAPVLPHIGEAIESGGFPDFDCYSRYRVFEITHKVKGIAELVTQNQREVKERQGASVLVWAYLEDGL